MPEKWSVDSETGCWLWLLATNRKGYGVYKRDGDHLAHRWTWRRTHGPVPAGMQLDHICRNPTCVNPGHLRLVTPSGNSQNRKARSHSSSAFRGVHRDKSGGGWIATVDKRYLGAYESEEHAARVATAFRTLTMPWALEDRSAVGVGRAMLDCYGAAARPPGPQRPTRRVGVDNARAKLTEDAVRDIRRRAEAAEPYAVIAAEYGVSKSVITHIKQRKTWGHVADATA